MRCHADASGLRRGGVPTSEDVLGFPLGSREVTAAETNEYVDAVDAASDRVVSGTFGSSWQGREMRYALVGDPESVTPWGSSPSSRR